MSNSQEVSQGVTTAVQNCHTGALAVKEQALGNPSGWLPAAKHHSPQQARRLTHSNALTTNQEQTSPRCQDASRVTSALVHVGAGVDGGWQGLDVNVKALLHLVQAVAVLLQGESSSSSEPMSVTDVDAVACKHRTHERKAIPKQAVQAHTCRECSPDALQHSLSSQATSPNQQQLSVRHT